MISVIILKPNEGNCIVAGEALSNYFVLGESLKENEEDIKPRSFESYSKAKENWDVIFNSISPIKKEFYKRLFVALYSPRICTVDIQNLKKDILNWGLMQNPFYILTLGQLYSETAERLWNSGEPLSNNL